MSEGFFADVAVLVEGEDDRAAILGIAADMGYDLESNGFSVIPCRGKTSLDRPAVLFQHLGIPVYVVWDSDRGKDAKPEDNHRLLRLFGQPVTDWPCQVHDRFACFEKNLECTLRDEIGATEFDQCLQECQNTFCIPKKDHAMKCPTVIVTILQEARKQGLGSTTLKNIVSKIMALKK
jgi:predicted ATP-dependent endonuclease of OLD family